MNSLPIKTGKAFMLWQCQDKAKYLDKTDWRNEVKKALYAFRDKYNCLPVEVRIHPDWIKQIGLKRIPLKPITPSTAMNRTYIQLELPEHLQK